MLVTLAYFTQQDFDQLIEWINNEALLMNWSGRMFNFPLTHDSLQWYIEGTNEPPTSDAYVFKAINETGETVGHISLGGISTLNNNARISRVFVSPQARGKQVCQQIVKQVLQFGFETLSLHRIGLGVYDKNTSAIHCYQQTGMVIEGVTRDCFLYNDEYWSMVELSMLQSEWQNLKP